MDALRKYNERRHDISKALAWKGHLTATGRDGERCKIHSIGANPSLALQYVTSGQNYWDCNKETTETFRRYLNAEFEKRLVECINAAIEHLEKDKVELREAAKKEYMELFEESTKA